MIRHRLTLVGILFGALTPLVAQQKDTGPSQAGVAK
jgi:hypothetical protein